MDIKPVKDLKKIHRINMDEIIISYEQGYHNWYISEFYKFFHKKLEENYNIHFKYIPINSFSERYGKTINNSDPNIFNWYNLILENPKNGSLFVHTWNDYSQVIAEQIIDEGYNVKLFSSSSNITTEIIDRFKGRLNIQPSIYCLENWSNINLVEKNYNSVKKINKAFFIGYLYGIRENIYQSLIDSESFIIKNRRILNQNLNHELYYETLSKHRFGISLNGVANICYRDLEIFGLGLINLREKLTTLTKNPLINGEHYIEFFDESLISDLISGVDIKKICEDRLDKLLDENNEHILSEMSKTSREWYLENCIPSKQYDILIDLTSNLQILE